MHMHIVHRKSAFCSSFSFLKQIQKNNYKSKKKRMFYSTMIENLAGLSYYLDLLTLFSNLNNCTLNSKDSR